MYIISFSSSCRHVVHHLAKLFRCASCLHRFFCTWRFPRKRRNRSCQGPPSFPCLCLNLKHTSASGIQLIHQQITNRSGLIELSSSWEFTSWSKVWSSGNGLCACCRLFLQLKPAELLCLHRSFTCRLYCHYALSWLCRCYLMTCSSLRYENRIHVGLSKSCVVRCIVKCKRVSFNQWRWE